MAAIAEIAKEILPASTCTIGQSGNHSLTVLNIGH
jgi:hypothetical protein